MLQRTSEFADESELEIIRAIHHRDIYKNSPNVEILPYHEDFRNWDFYDEKNGKVYAKYDGYFVSAPDNKLSVIEYKHRTDNQTLYAIDTSKLKPFNARINGKRLIDIWDEFYYYFQLPDGLWRVDVWGCGIDIKNFSNSFVVSTNGIIRTRCTSMRRRKERINGETGRNEPSIVIDIDVRYWGEKIND